MNRTQVVSRQARTAGILALALGWCANFAGAAHAQTTSPAASPRTASSLVAYTEVSAQPVRKGTLYVHAEAFRRSSRIFGVEQITVRELETGREWSGHYEVGVSSGYGVTLSCEGATIGKHCKISITWRARGRDHRDERLERHTSEHHGRHERHERLEHSNNDACESYDERESSNWERTFTLSGQSETFYNP